MDVTLTGATGRLGRGLIDGMREYGREWLGVESCAPRPAGAVA